MALIRNRLRSLLLVPVFFLVSLTPHTSDAQSGFQALSWQEAVAQLAQERTMAETCAGVIKHYGSLDTVKRGAADYDLTRAEYDGVIAGLIVTLASRAEPTSFLSLQDRLRRGFAGREAFCKSAKALLPQKRSGERGVLDNIVVGAAVKPVLDALFAIYKMWQDENSLTRATIQTQLEAARWLEFNLVPLAGP